MSGGRYGHSIYRVRTERGVVKLAERIQTGAVIRDLVEMPSGEIVTWDGATAMQTLTPTSHVFSKCAACHTLNRDWPARGIGPDLWRVVGRPAAAVDGYAYSAPMKALRARWSPARLDWFLRDPAAAVPGNLMEMPGISDDAERREIIRYLTGIARE
jgi:cytochrome c